MLDQVEIFHGLSDEELKALERVYDEMVGRKVKWLAVRAMHGLANRMRAYCSASAWAAQMGRRLLLLWEPDVHCAARFDELFEVPEGVTVVAGGITTFGCATFMFPCQLTFFSKMATLIGGTIFFSLLFALFFFMPLCALIGPQGEIKSVGERVRALCGGGTKKQTAV